MFVIKRRYNLQGEEVNTILSEPLTKEEAEKRLEMFRTQYQSLQYYMEDWKGS